MLTAKNEEIERELKSMFERLKAKEELTLKYVQ